MTGKVVDATGEPIIGAAVVVKESGTGAVTNLDGNFVVEAAPGNTLEISFIGYQTTIVKVGTSNSYSVTMQDASQTLDEVVVTAMGIKKEKKALGYAIEDVGAEELMRNKSTNAINSLAGKIAGVNITQGGGAAGGGSESFSVVVLLWNVTINLCSLWTVSFTITQLPFLVIRLSTVVHLLLLLQPTV